MDYKAKRRQHTLASISSQGSRSRSPIVDKNGPHHERLGVILNCDTSTSRVDGREFNFINEGKSDPYYDDAANDDLSLDQVLAEIETNRLQNLMINQPNKSVSTEQSSENNNSNNPNQISDSRNEFKSFKDGSASFGHNNSTITLSMCSTTPSLSGEDETITASDNPYHQSDSNHSNNPSNDTSQNSSSESRYLSRTNGFEIVWLNFTYTVEPNILEDPRWGKINKLFHKEKRTILKGLSGGVRSGQMVALMGPSGAGKTCLLECISGIRRTGTTGKILLRGRNKAQLVIVPQYDNFMPQFTVEEIIIYGSKIKNPSKFNHKAIADAMIKQFGLDICRNTNIQLCSGGQRKRVAIAQELVSKPNILILDEPTSGLDSSCCYQTMRVLRDVLDKSLKTNEPMVCITTIHQPSAKVFKMFDFIYLLSKTGHIAYSGPSVQLLSTIKGLTGLQCPRYSNPSDYMIELVSYDYGEEPVEELIAFEKIKARQFVKDFEARANIKVSELITDPYDDDTLSESTSSSLNSTNRSSSIEMQAPFTTSNLKEKIRLEPHFKSKPEATLNSQLDLKNNHMILSLRKATNTNNLRHPFFWHLLIHIQRSFFQAIRDPILNNMRILIHIVFAYLLVVLFGQKSGEARGCPPILGLPIELTDPDNENVIDLADNVAYLFMCIMMITYVSLMTTVLTFPIDIKTIGKEYKNGWYATLTYFLGKTIADLPFVIIYPIVYCTIVWKLTNQGSDQFWRFMNFTALIIMNAMNSQSFGLILGALFVNSVTAATFLGPVMTIPWYLFTGFTKRIHRLDSVYRYASKFLFTRFVFEGLLDTTYGHERCNCSMFLEKYYKLRYEEAIRLGQMISAETLSSLDYYDSFDNIAPNTLSNKSTPSNWFEKTVDAATSVFVDGEDLDIGSLMDTNVKASSLFSFGLDFEPTCPVDYKNFIIQDFRLDNSASTKAIYMTILMLFITRTLTFIIVSWKIRTRQI